MAEIDEENSAKLHGLRCCGGGHGYLSDWIGHPDQHDPSSFFGFLSRSFAANSTAKFR
jgi:hypothetical protein